VSLNSLLIGDIENLKYIVFKIIMYIHIYFGLGVFYAGMHMHGSMGFRAI
jgi:hypothetical protein